MGNDKSRQQTPDADSSAHQPSKGGWVTVCLTPEETLTYNPKVSYAVCVGVGQQLKMDSGHLGHSANNDARRMKEQLQENCGFMKEHVTILTSDLPGHHSTADNIKKELTARAQDVTEDGVLLLHFSGHCDKIKSGQVYLVPADFCSSDRDSALYISHIVQCIQGSRAKCFIFIADCCYAGQIAKCLLQEYPSGVPMYILAACSPMQKSIYYKKLGHGFFTYFILKYLKERLSDGEEEEEVSDRHIFPTNQLIDYCKGLCEAVAVIMSPACGFSMLMEPELQYIHVAEDDDDDDCHNLVDSLDGMTGTRIYKNLKKFSHITLYLSCVSPIRCRTQIPEVVGRWVHTKVKDALLHLQREGVLSAPEMYHTILVFLSQAIAALIYQEFVETGCATENLLQSDVCVLVCLSCAEVLADVSEDLIPKLEDMSTCTEFYIIKIKSLMSLDLRSEKLKDLLTLLNRVAKDITHDKQSSETDTVDGEMVGGMNEADNGHWLYERLERLSHHIVCPQIPQLTDDDQVKQTQ